MYPIRSHAETEYHLANIIFLGKLLGLPQGYESRESAFTSFVDDMFDILKQENFSIIKRKVLVNTNVVGGISLSADTEDKIHIAENLSDLFETLSLHCRPYWNWMNIRMLEKMAGNSLAAKQSIKKYKDNICSRKIKNVISEISNLEVLPSSYTKVKEYYEKDFDDLTIKDIVGQWNDIEKMFNVAETMLLRSIGVKLAGNQQWRHHDDQSGTGTQ